MLNLMAGTVRGEVTKTNKYGFDVVTWFLEDEDHQIIVTKGSDYEGGEELLIINVDELYAIALAMLEHRDRLGKDNERT
jgi:hypothetical protein